MTGFRATCELATRSACAVRTYSAIQWAVAVSIPHSISTVLGFYGLFNGDPDGVASVLGSSMGTAIKLPQKLRQW